MRKKGPKNILFASTLTSSPIRQWKKISIVQYQAPLQSNELLLPKAPVVGYVIVCIDHLESKVSFSFCSPKDQYNKGYGRWLAAARLNTPENRVRRCWRYFKNPITTEQIQVLLIEVATARRIQWILRNVKSLDQIR